MSLYSLSQQCVALFFCFCWFLYWMLLKLSIWGLPRRFIKLYWMCLLASWVRYSIPNTKHLCFQVSISAISWSNSTFGLLFITFWMCWDLIIFEVTSSPTPYHVSCSWLESYLFLDTNLKRKVLDGRPLIPEHVPLSNLSKCNWDSV